MFFFSGIFFPLDRFPPVVAAAARFLPLTSAVEASRALILGRVDRAFAGNILILLAAGAVFFAIALRRMKGRIVR